MKIVVVELHRVNEFTGLPIRNSDLSFKSWKKAWEYFEEDLLHDKDCPNTKVQIYGEGRDKYVVIQHWGDSVDTATESCSFDLSGKVHHKYPKLEMVNV